MNILRGPASIACTLALGALATLQTPSVHAATIYGVDFSSLLSFDSADPAATLSSVYLSGLSDGGDYYSILEIDFRPSTGILYGLGNAPGSKYQLFTIDLASGAATKVGVSFIQSSSAFSFGFDFDPVNDTIRLVNNAQQNGRIDPTTGAYTADTNLSLSGGAPNVASAAHSNSYPGATSTTLYDISLDAAHGYTIAYVQTPPNSGQLVFSSGRLLDPVQPTSEIGFDLSPTNVGFLSAPVYDSGFFSTNIYTADPATGSTTLLGTRSDFVRDIAIAPVPEPSTLAMAAVGMLGAGLSLRRRNRSKPAPRKPSRAGDLRKSA